MQNKHTLDAVKGRVLDFWIELNKQEYSRNTYSRYIEGVLFQDFELTHIEYYYIDGCKLKKFEASENQCVFDCIPINIALTNANQLELGMNELKLIKETHPYIDRLLVIQKNGQLDGMLFFKASQKWNEFAQTAYIQELVDLLYETSVMLKSQIEVHENNLLKTELLHMTEIFHSTMNVTHIIDTVVKEIQFAFSENKFQVILSNDQDRVLPKNVHIFDYSNEKPATIEAFVSGELTFESIEDNRYTAINSPIQGQQGTYGVIRIEADCKNIFSERDEKKIEYLGTTSGKALENAKLYHQSHGLVSDLQLINESSQHLNMNLSKNEMLLYLSNLIKKSFSPREMAVVFFEKEMQIKTGTTAYFFNPEAKVYLDFVVEHFERTTEPLFIANFQEISNKQEDFNSLMAIPIMNRQQVFGFVLVVHPTKYYFSFDSYKLMQSIIRHSSLAISNILLREQLQDLVDCDHLTKLYARGFLDRTVENSVQQDESGIFVLFDIDDFKKVNDQFGHQVGDKTLQLVSNIIREEVGNKGICARWGGEEIAIYLANIAMIEVLAIVDRICEKVPQHTNPSVTLSAGISCWDQQGNIGYQSIFNRADAALYIAKSNGKNQSKLYFTDDELLLKNELNKPIVD